MSCPDRWDHQTWKSDFAKASRTRNREWLQALRRQVYMDTLDVLRMHDERGAFEPMRAGTRFYAETGSLVVDASRRERFGTSISVLNADFLEVARLLADGGARVAVLNMANRNVPGGGVLQGSGAQEENLFRRSSLAHSLYQFSQLGAMHGVPAHAERIAYPIPRESGGIYSPEVMVFRSSESTGYAYLPSPFEVGVITVPAISRPTIEVRDGEERLIPELADATRCKIRGILRIGAWHQQDDLVLSAFGCGAFRNPPAHMAELFAETLVEAEFAGVFRRVVFAIIDDHNARGEGNYLPFLRGLRKSKGPQG